MRSPVLEAAVIILKILEAESVKGEDTESSLGSAEGNQDNSVKDVVGIGNINSSESDEYKDDKQMDRCPPWWIWKPIVSNFSSCIWNERN